MITKHLTIDIETNKLDFRDLSGLKALHCMSYQWGLDPKAKVKRAVGLDEVREFFESLHCYINEAEDREVFIYAHNGVSFDFPALYKLLGGDLLRDMTLPSLSGRLHIMDTKLLAQLAYPDMVRTVDKTQRFKSPRNMKDPRLMYSHALKAWGMRLGVHKGSIGDSTKEETWEVYTEEMGDYCDDDVRVTVALVNWLRSQKVSQWLWTEQGLKVVKMEADFAALIRHQQTNGIGFDVESAQKLASRIRDDLEPLEESLKGVFPPTIETTKTPEYWTMRRKSDDTVLLKGMTKGALEILRKRNNKENPDDTWMPKDIVYIAGPMQTKSIPFNPNSRQQIVKRLTEAYGWEPVAYTDPTERNPDGQAKVDADILGSLPYKEAKQLADYMARKKILSSIDGDGSAAWLPNYKEDTGRIHGGIDTLGTNTSRCSHSRPNLGQVPSSRKVYGKECRQLFGPRPGWKQYGCDASGLELRVLAGYLATFDNGAYADIVVNGDVHTFNQERAGLATRDIAKTVAYCIIYGGGVKAVAAAAGVSQRQGKKMREDFLNGVPGLTDLLDIVSKGIKKRGYLIGLDRRHQFPRSAHSALNLILQGAGAMIMKVALIEFYWSMQLRGYVLGDDWALIANVHDEWQAEFNPNVPGIEEYILEAGPRAIEKAGTLLNFKCPLDGEGQIGANWYECH